MLLLKFNNYRDFLREFIENLPKKGRGEVTRMAEAMRVTPSLLSQVLAGDRDLTSEQGQELAHYLGLDSIDTDYFLLSIQHQRAGTQKLQKYYKKKMQELKIHAQNLAVRIKQDRILSEEAKAVFYSDWRYAGIWLFTSLEGGRSQEQIAKQFQIAPVKTKEIIEFLVKNHLCEARGDLFIMGPQSVHLERGSPFLVRHHTNWRLRSIENANQLSDEELMYSAPISISKADFSRLRTQLANFIKESTDLIMASPAEDLACLNLDLFWIRK